MYSGRLPLICIILRNFSVKKTAYEYLRFTEAALMSTGYMTAQVSTYPTEKAVGTKRRLADVTGFHSFLQQCAIIVNQSLHGSCESIDVWSNLMKVHPRTES